MQKTHEGKSNEDELKSLDDQYWNGIVSKLKVSLEDFGEYKGDFIASDQTEDNLLGIFDFGELLPLMRRDTVYGLFSRFIGTLESSNHPNIFSRFPDDSIYFTKSFWEKILHIFPGGDRTFVSNQLLEYLMFRTSLQSLAQIRLTRLMLDEHKKDIHDVMRLK